MEWGGFSVSTEKELLIAKKYKIIR
jgi:hypothetical protein